MNTDMAPTRDYSADDDLNEWARRRLDAPFKAEECSDPGMMRAKLLHQAKLPPIVSYYLSLWTDDLNTLRLCPSDELVEGCRAFMKIFDRIQFDTDSFESARDLQNSIGAIQWQIIRYAGVLSRELRYRENISDDQYRAEREDTHRHLMDRCDAEKVALRAEAVS
jgi:hypothetical protein